MKEKNKGVNLAILIIGTLLFIFLIWFTGKVNTNTKESYQGILTELQVIVATILVITNKKVGFITSVILCCFSLFRALTGVLAGMSIAIIGVLTSTVSIVILVIIYTYLQRADRQKKELSEQYEQIMDSNRLMQEKDEALKTLAYKDEMTDMYNAVYFNEQMEILLNQNMPFKIIYMDLDNFKNVNDTFGPEVGDSVLKSYASRISKYCGENYLCARTGGDDFGILLTGEPTQADVLNLVEQIRRIFAEPLTVQGANISLTASYGVAGSPNDGKTTDILLDNAIMAVYNAKASGKDRPCFFSQP